MGGNAGAVVSADAVDWCARAGAGYGSDFKDQADLSLSPGDEGGETAASGEDAAIYAGACGRGWGSTAESDCRCRRRKPDVSAGPFGFAQGRLPGGRAFRRQGWVSVVVPTLASQGWGTPFRATTLGKKLLRLSRLGASFRIPGWLFGFGC